MESEFVCQQLYDKFCRRFDHKQFRHFQFRDKRQFLFRVERNNDRNFAKLGEQSEHYAKQWVERKRIKLLRSNHRQFGYGRQHDRQQRRADQFKQCFPQQRRIMGNQFYRRNGRKLVYGPGDKLEQRHFP